MGGNSSIIENVVRDNSSSINGAGIYAVNGNASIIGNEIRGNTAAEDGGGVLINTCSGRLADNLVTDNHSMDDAGGLRIYFGLNMLIENNVISQNTAVDAAGGAKLSHSKNRFNNNILEDNQADTAGAMELDNDATVVTNCIFKNNRARLGAAIHAKAASDPIHIQDTVFEGNTAAAYGGALHFENNAHAVTLTGIEAINNTAPKGGAIATNNSTLDISDATFEGNSASEAGGALFLSGFETALANEAVSIDIDVSTNEETPKPVKLRRVRLNGNSALNGGAIFATGHTQLDAANLIVTENNATESGGGISLITTRGTLCASVITSNKANTAAGILLDQADQFEIRSCIIADNLIGEGILITGTPPAISYNDVYNNQGGDYAGMPSATGTNGNISQDPGFINDQGPDFDYRLKPGSPCINTGDPNEALQDLDKTRSDMGAYAGPDGNWEDSEDPEDLKDPETPKDPEEPGDEGLVIIDPTIDSDPTQAFLSVADKLQWPAGGHELIIRAETRDGSPWEGSADQLTIAADESDVGLRYSVAAQPMAPGLTLIAVQPEISGDTDAYQTAVRAFIESRPQDERIALYGWGDDFIQITDFTTRRDRLYAQLQRLNRLIVGKNAASPRQALIEALEIMENVGKGNRQGMRSIVFIAGNEPAGEVPNTLQGVTVQWVVPQTALNSLSQGRGIGFTSASNLEDALLQISERLDEIAADSFFKIGVCSDPDDKIAATVSDGGEGYAASVNLNRSFDGEQGGVCDPEKIVAGQREGIHTISLFLDEEQLAVYQQRLDAVEALHDKYNLGPNNPLAKALYLWGTSVNGFEGAKDKFDITLSLDPSQEPVPATAKFRGQNALFKSRKSYTVNIDGGDQRFFSDGAGSDEFYLIAMAQDPGLFFGYMGDTFYSEYDLFPLRFRYVELKLNNETQGVYLLVEKREEELEKDSARLRGVVRRRMINVEVEYAIEDDAQTQDAYTETLARSVRKARLPDYLRERMDLDQYLYWMGINSILEIADTLDELLFVSTESIDAKGQATDYFRVMGWDPEDMQGPCESGDLFRNDYDLTFCQEAGIERKMILHPEIFADYVDVLKVLTSEITPEKFQALADKIKAELFPLLERDGVAQAMQREDFTDAETAKAIISEKLIQSRQAFESRIEVLKAGIQAYENDVQ